MAALTSMRLKDLTFGKLAQVRLGSCAGLDMRARGAERVY